MRELNVNFTDLYKTVDRFIKDAYSSTEGVSVYLQIMDQNGFRGRRLVPTWDADYAKLKRMRWIRNQLAHEVGFDSDICGPADFEWLRSFKARLYSADDPLSVMYKTEAAERQQLEMMRRSQARVRREQTGGQQTRPGTNGNPTEPGEKRRSLFQRIKDKLSGRRKNDRT